MEHICCNGNCDQGRRCPNRQACDMAEYAVRVVRPNGDVAAYTTRAASSMDAANDATQTHGLGCRVSARRVG